MVGLAIKVRCLWSRVTMMHILSRAWICVCDFRPVNYHIPPPLRVILWGVPAFQYLCLANDYAEVIPETEHNLTNCLDKKLLPSQIVKLHNRGNYVNEYGKPVFECSISFIIRFNVVRFLNCDWNKIMLILFVHPHLR
jgi:hypothetical protein